MKKCHSRLHEKNGKISLYATLYCQHTMNGRQSFLLNDIKQVIRNGGNVTHILNVKVSNQPESNIGNRIRRRIFNLINGHPITKQLDGIPVTITWRSNANSSSAYYHADVSFFTDLVVKRHTKALLSDLLGMLQKNQLII